ncbi:hypothetical protein [Streptomyces sp. SBT349]|uniref:hypothetical protein n=1 Tax=Streptomyces sp. SBT349 TaxID=1580539 RepID=UPI00066ECCEB|nr:hypothetical protein [Streptomyces sp. SBT349]
MGVIAWFRGRGKGPQEPPEETPGAAPEEAPGAAEAGAEAEGDAVGIPQQTGSAQAADSEAGEGAAKP